MQKKNPLAHICANQEKKERALAQLCANARRERVIHKVQSILKNARTPMRAKPCG